MIIAEVGANHFDFANRQGWSPMMAARAMIAVAARAGADCIKFQSYKAGSLVSREAPAYWDREEESASTQFELLSRYDSFGADEFRRLAKCCKAYGVYFASTPFDHDSADYLEELVPFFKVASADLTNHPLLDHLAAKGKPLLLSTGAATIGEIGTALDVIDDRVPVTLLHCVLSYPTAYHDANLGMITHLAAAFPGHAIGYSDHTKPDDAMTVPSLAYTLGARVLEKHFTLDKTLPGNDHYHAMDADDLRQLVANIIEYKTIMGSSTKRPLPCEAESRRQARRSIVAAVPIYAGTTITRDMVTFKRPGTGIPPAMLDGVLGRVAPRDIADDAVLSWADLCDRT